MSDVPATATAEPAALAIPGPLDAQSASHDPQISSKELRRLHALASGQDGGTLLGIAAANALLLHEIAERLRHATEFKKQETDFEAKFRQLSAQAQQMRTQTEGAHNDLQQLKAQHEGFASDLAEQKETLHRLGARLDAAEPSLSGSSSASNQHPTTTHRGSRTIK
jgi:chromosome segregation ATPase